MAGFLTNNNSPIPGGLLRRLRKFNDGGWDYIDNVVNKSNAIGKEQYEELKSGGIVDGEYNFSLSDIPGVHKTTHDNTYENLQNGYAKDKFLEQIAAYDEIDFVLNTISDETIIYDEGGYFVKPNGTTLSTKFSLKDTVLQDINDEFEKMYYLFRFNDNDYAWRLFKEWLVYGVLAFEILYNDSKAKIVGFKRLDPYSLKQKITKVGNKYISYWDQYENDITNNRQLAENEIIYISYNDDKLRKSYIESILRSFNILRTLEDTRAIWGIIHSTLRMKMIVPINTKNEARAKAKVSELRNKFKENVTIDSVSGEFAVNGTTGLQMFKNYIFPSNDAGQIEIEPIQTSMNDAISTDELEYFANKFKRNTKLPFSRFDREGGSGTYSLDASIENDEIRFVKFISRLRNTFGELILKPFKIQLGLKMPHLKTDFGLWNTINLDFEKHNLFEELKKMELTQRRIDHIETLGQIMSKKFNVLTGDYDEVPFFSSRYLIEKYLKLSEEELRKNEDYKETFKERQPEDWTPPDDGY